MTPYQLLQQEQRALQGGRQVLRDPGSAGTINVTANRGVCTMALAAGTRTMEAATRLPIGTEVLICSTVAGAIVAYGSGAGSPLTRNAGQWVKLVIVPNSSGVNQWEIEG